mmetsp:Transcript_25239/g.55337  ORF Transcript_25239/g.55337 Transcript_25239/m.55337 type:complete len:80 (+) Transcript_25239:290-529(+)
MFYSLGFENHYYYSRLAIPTINDLMFCFRKLELSHKVFYLGIYLAFVFQLRPPTIVTIATIFGLVPNQYSSFIILYFLN